MKSPILFRLFYPHRLFMMELPHFQDSFVEKLLELMPRLVACKPLDLVKILQTTLRQSRFIHLRLPEQVSLDSHLQNLNAVVSAGVFWLVILL